MVILKMIFSSKTNLTIIYVLKVNNKRTRIRSKRYVQSKEGQYEYSFILYISTKAPTVPSTAPPPPSPTHHPFGLAL